nr:hypothetical protein [Plectonema radiosum]
MSKEHLLGWDLRKTYTLPHPTAIAIIFTQKCCRKSHQHFWVNVSLTGTINDV